MSDEGNVTNFEFVLKFVAFTNTLMAFVSVWVGVIYPYFEFVTEVSYNSFYILLIIYAVDLFATIIFLLYIKKYFNNTKGYYLRIIPYFIISLISRFMFAGVAAGPIDDTIMISGQIFLALTSIMYAFVLRYISTQEIIYEYRKAFKVIMYCNVTVALLFLNIIYPVFTPSLPLNIIFIILFVLLGITKEVSYIVSAITFLRWSENLAKLEFGLDENIEDETEIDLAWPEAKVGQKQ